MRSKLYYTRLQAEEIIQLIRLKCKADTTRQKTIRAKIRNLGFYASDFDFQAGYTEEDFLSVVRIVDATGTKKKSMHEKKTKVRHQKGGESDETYVISLCNEVLGQKALCQHRFDFLRGDTDTRLPVDAYYPSLNLVVEYHERQHTEAVSFFDKRSTVSGISRGEQRKLYDQRRRDVLPVHGIRLIEIRYSDFTFNASKKIIRNRPDDLAWVRSRLASISL